MIRFTGFGKRNYKSGKNRMRWECPCCKPHPKHMQIHKKIERRTNKLIMNEEIKIELAERIHND
tara:strand:- start:18633 stop:18824 length:192 start_codon:yes stop_codon:yes gene_type:complete